MFLVCLMSINNHVRMSDSTAITEPLLNIKDRF